MREPDPVPVALDAVVREAIERTRQRYPHVAFVADLEPTTLPGVPDALVSAVANLLDNAAKASSVLVAQGADEPEVPAAIEISLDAGTLRIRDHGPGIDDADLPHVFERFYRGNGARERPGSGLGLAIVAQAIAAHGGEVRAERPPGGGALFTVRLPAAVPPGS